MGQINSEEADILVAKNSMPEDDPNGNTLHDAREIRWGPQHAGAKLLASQYTKGNLLVGAKEELPFAEPIAKTFRSIGAPTGFNCFLLSVTRLEKRIQEIISIILCIILMVYNFYFICRYFDVRNWYLIIPSARKRTREQVVLDCGMLSALVLGILTADLASGIVHWGADTWGSVDMPFIGRNFLRPFREHHIDPTSITRHDFIETNGDNFAVTVPYLLFMAYKFTYWHDIEIRQIYNFEVYMFLLAIFVSMTNQVGPLEPNGRFRTMLSSRCSIAVS